MKRIYDWITKANQILLFFAIIGATALIAYTVYASSRRDDPPHVLVAQTTEEAKASIVEDVRFIGQSSGLYVFGIMKHMITAAEERRRKSFMLASASSLGNEELADTGEMVNVVFSKGEERVRTLLQNDGLVLSHRVPGEYGSEKFKALLFLCVTEDTDGNHRLDKSDRNDLYVISDGLEKADLVVKQVLAYQVISPTHVAVKTGEGNVLQFWDVDTETQTKKEVVWK